MVICGPITCHDKVCLLLTDRSDGMLDHTGFYIGGMGRATSHPEWMKLFRGTPEQHQSMVLLS
jgi:hypothetical protein